MPNLSPKISEIQFGNWSSAINFSRDVQKAMHKLASFELGPTATPTFSTVTLTDLTASRLLSSSSTKSLVSTDLISWVSGTANEINVSDDGDGSITIGLVDPLIVGKGGTGLATLTDHGILLGSGTGAVTPLGVATDGQLPIGSTGADPVLSTLTEGAGIDITNGAGSITIAVTASGLNHNSLSGLQGGTAAEYYHLTSTEHGYVSGVNAQSVLTTASPTFAGLTVDTDTLYVNPDTDRVQIGSTSATLLGSHYLAMVGPAASVLAYPSFNIYTTADDYPVIGFLAYAHNNVQFRFDGYYDGVTNKEITSSATSMARILKLGNSISIGILPTTVQGGQHAGTEWMNAFTMSKTGNLALVPTNPAAEGAFGTNALRVVTISAGTAPITSPADLIQVWAADRAAAAGKCGLFIRSEDGTTHVFSDRVGIGTVAPNELLEVNGKIRADTAFNLNGADGVTQTAGSPSSITTAGGIVTAITVSGSPSYAGVLPLTDNTYYLGKNDDDAPFAWKGLILVDQAGTGKYYRLEVYNDALRIVDLSD